MVLLLYVPVLHQGYINLFGRYKKAVTLFIIGESLIAEFPQLSRELRRIEPKKIAKAVEALGVFKNVVVIEKNQIGKLSQEKIVSADEVEMRELIEKYLPGAKVTFDTSFLRWDAKKIQQLETVAPDVRTDTTKLAKKLMGIAGEEAQKSSDWFRQVGAVLWRGDRILAVGHNERQPTPREPYAVDDPRNHVEPGTDTHLRQTIHAEQSILIQAAREGFSVKGASLYVTTFPCPDCAALIAASGIKECYFREGYSEIGGAELLKGAGVKVIKVKNNPQKHS